MLKKIIISIWAVTALVLGVLVANYYSNRSFIEKYDNGVFQQNELGFLGFTQPYVNSFNKGNTYMKLGNHTKAKQEYQAALNHHPNKPYDCKIRVNYALAYVDAIDTRKITKDNYEDVIQICETAKTILSENKCATEDNNGHYYAAQKLYNEINQFIEELKNQFENPNPTPTPTPEPTSDPNGPSPSPTPTSKPDGDASPTPTPTPQEGDPTPTPQDGEPTPTPQDGQDTPTPTPSDGDGTPTPTPSDGEGTPTPTPGEGTGTPTPTPGADGTGTPTPTPGGDGQGTPTPTPGGDGQGGGNGQPEPTKTPAEKIREIQERANKERAGGGGGSGRYGGDDYYNPGDTASW